MEQQDQPIKINKTADKKAYMREYMKTYMVGYYERNLEKMKIVDNRKYWRSKLKKVGKNLTNEELDSLSHEDCSNIYQFQSAKNYMEKKPELFKFI